MSIPDGLRISVPILPTRIHEIVSAALGPEGCANNQVSRSNPVMSPDRRHTAALNHGKPPARSGLRYACICVAAALTASCDSAIQPPTDVAEGTIRGVINYVSQWPPREEINDLRFVAMRFIPADTADFLQLNRLEFSDGLDYFVDEQTVLLSDVPAGTYPFAVVARQRTTDILSWQALGIYDENEGVFIVARDETVDVAITVDFDNLPDFP